MSQPDRRTTFLLRGDDSGDRVALMENVVAPRSGPPLHRHDFDEAFYMLEGELTFLIDGELSTRRMGELAFVPRNVPHALRNRTDAPARYLLVCTPAGLERVFARKEAADQGLDAPEWAQQPGPEIIELGPPLDDDR